MILIILVSPHMEEFSSPKPPLIHSFTHRCEWEKSTPFYVQPLQLRYKPLLKISKFELEKLHNRHAVTVRELLNIGSVMWNSHWRWVSLEFCCNNGSKFPTKYRGNPESRIEYKCDNNRSQMICFFNLYSKYLKSCIAFWR